MAFTTTLEAENLFILHAVDKFPNIRSIIIEIDPIEFDRDVPELAVQYETSTSHIEKMVESLPWHRITRRGPRDIKLTAGQRPVKTPAQGKTWDANVKKLEDALLKRWRSHNGTKPRETPPLSLFQTPTDVEESGKTSLYPGSKVKMSTIATKMIATGGDRANTQYGVLPGWKPSGSSKRKASSIESGFSSNVSEKTRKERKVHGVVTADEWNRKYGSMFGSLGTSTNGEALDSATSRNPLSTLSVNSPTAALSCDDTLPAFTDREAWSRHNLPLHYLPPRYLPLRSGKQTVEARSKPKISLQDVPDNLDEFKRFVRRDGECLFELIKSLKGSQADGQR